MGGKWIKKTILFFKEYGFNGVNLYSLLNLNTINSAGATLSLTGSISVTLPTVIALSWSGGLFLSTLENLIPNNINKTKAIVSTSKMVISFPIRLAKSPRLADISNLKKPIKKFLLYLANKL